MSIEDIKIVEAMLKYGGGFANALAKAAMRADKDNLKRIKQGWPELWDEYAKLVVFYNRKPQSKEVV